MGPKGCFPFVTFCDADQMVSVARIELGVYFCMARSVEEFRNEWKRIAILFGDLVQSMEVGTEM